MARIPTRNIALIRDLESSIEALVSAGRYADASEVVPAGLRLLLEGDHRMLHVRRLAAMGGDVS